MANIRKTTVLDVMRRLLQVRDHIIKKNRTGHLFPFDLFIKNSSVSKSCLHCLKQNNKSKTHYLTREFHVKFHAKNGYRRNRKAMSAISVFQVICEVNRILIF